MNKFKCKKDTPTGTYKAGEVYTDELCGMLPEYFAAYELKTEDGVDMYSCDNAFYIDERFGICPHVNVSKMVAMNHKYFSTREAAQAFLDEQNKPKYQEGKVYKDEDLTKAQEQIQSLKYSQRSYKGGATKRKKKA